MLHNLFYIQWMNDCLVVYIKRYVTCSINNETIMHQFQNMKLVEGNCKFYVFVYFIFIFIVVVVNIWISPFIKLYNLYFLRNILRKISETFIVWRANPFVDWWRERATVERERKRGTRVYFKTLKNRERERERELMKW